MMSGRDAVGKRVVLFLGLLRQKGKFADAGQSNVGKFPAVVFLDTGM
jgi:hypothetical protein